MSELNEIFDTVKDVITSLMKLSMIIRAATPRDRYLKAITSTKSPFTDTFDILHVGHKYPKVDTDDRRWLKERLGKAITQRRQYLKYCRDHHGKFNQDPAPILTSTPQNQDEHGLQIDIAYPRTQAGTVKSVPNSAMAPTDASTLQPSQIRQSVDKLAITNKDDDDDHRSQTSYATSVQDDDSGTHLKPPRLQEITQMSPFECPYCWEIQDIKTERSWRSVSRTAISP